MVLTLFSVVLISWIGLHLHCLVFPPRFRARCTRIKWWMWSAARAHLFPLGCLPRHPAVRSLMARCPEPPDWWWTEPLTGEGEMPAWGANVPTHSNTTHRLPEMCTRLLNIPYLFLSRLELTPVESCVFLYYFDNWFLFFNGNFKIAYMVKRTCTQATRSCISYRGGKKNPNSELLRVLTAAKEGRIQMDRWKDEGRGPCPDLAGCVWASRVAQAAALPFWTTKMLLAGCWWD